MTRDPADPGPAPGRRRVVVGGALLLAAIGSVVALDRGSDDDQTARPTIGWGGSEGHPSCVYDPERHIVDATIIIEGEAPRDGVTVTVTVTAYADENTSKPVGSGSRSVRVAGTVDTSLVVTIPVERAPHVDVDGETACRRSTEY